MEKKNEKKDVVIVCSTPESCKYDPYKDVQKVVPGLGVSIDDMLQTGIVKDAGEELDNNGIDSPSDIIGRISDVFDALDAARIIKKYGKKSPAKAQDGISQLTDTPKND